MKYFSIGIFVFLGMAILPKLNAQQLDVIDIESVFNKSIPLNLSKIATGVDYIPLELKDNCVLGDIYNVAISGENMALISEKQVFLFDTQGKFKYKIGGIGRGPGEYQQPRDIQFNDTGSSLFVLDMNGLQIIEYDLNGLSVKTIALPVKVFPEDMTFFDNHFYILTFRQGLGLPLVYKINNDGDLIQDLYVTCEAHQLSLSSYSEYGSFTKSENYFDLATVWNDTIFRIHPSGQKEGIYTVNYGKFKYPLKKDKNPERNQALIKGLAYQHWRAITKNYIFIHSQDGRDLKLIVFDRKSKAIIHSSNGRDDDNGGIKNDLDGGPGIDFIPSFQKNNGVDVIQCHSAISLIEHMAKDDSELDPTLRKLIQQLSEEDNPVVQIFHLK